MRAAVKNDLVFVARGERFVDERLSPLLIHQLPDGDDEQIKSLLLKYDGSAIQVDSLEHKERSE